ncbi:MAG: hypothetical protein EOO28_16720 [Comamonadaceae bacterium]|nr:MAG: hypothetical protein EOO28_16720 [Comamonadaceae bacterium]
MCQRPDPKNPMTYIAAPVAISAFLIALLQGCAATPAPVGAASVAQPPPQQKSCDAAAAQFTVGQAWNSPLAEGARQRAGADSVRALRPNQMVTMEFNGARLNLELDASDRITRVRCG